MEDVECSKDSDSNLDLVEFIGLKERAGKKEDSLRVVKADRVDF